MLRISHLFVSWCFVQITISLRLFVLKNSATLMWYSDVRPCFTNINLLTHIGISQEVGIMLYVIGVSKICLFSVSLTLTSCTGFCVALPFVNVPSMFLTPEEASSFLALIWFQIFETLLWLCLRSAYKVYLWWFWHFWTQSEFVNLLQFPFFYIVCRWQRTDFSPMSGIHSEKRSMSTDSG